MESFYFLIIYAFTEECLKYFIVSKKILSLSYGKGFVINAWIAGIGFSLVEMFVIYQKSVWTAIPVANIDLIKVSLLHMLTFGILGYFLSLQEERGINLKVLLFVFTIHLLFNYSIIYFGDYGNFMALGILAILSFLNLIYLFSVNKKLASD